MKQRIEQLEDLVKDLRIRVDTLERVTPPPPPSTEKEQQKRRGDGGHSGVFSAHNKEPYLSHVDETKRKIASVPLRGKGVAIMVVYAGGARVVTTAAEKDLVKRLRSEHDHVILVIFTADDSRVGAPNDLSAYIDYSASIRVDGSYRKSKNLPENDREWDNLIRYLKRV